VRQAIIVDLKSNNYVKTDKWQQFDSAELGKLDALISIGKRRRQHPADDVTIKVSVQGAQFSVRRNDGVMMTAVGEMTREAEKRVLAAGKSRDDMLVVAIGDVDAENGGSRCAKEVQWIVDNI
jgi:hypothetical protein